MILANIAYTLWAIAGMYVAYKIMRSVRTVPQRTEVIVERLGRYHETWHPGLHVLIPFIDRAAFTLDLKELSIDVPPQDCFTKDNVRVEVDGILYLSVMNSKQAAYGVTDYSFAAIQLAQTTTRAVVGTLELDRTFEERDVINARVVSALNEVSLAWGIKVHRYEVKNIVPPHSVKDAMERQMGAERDRRALLARSEGEKQARINDSEGKKQEMINRSMGEMQRRINEAEGKAQEIIALAEATAEAIRVNGAAIAEDGGAEAVSLRLSQQYLTRLSALSNGAKVVLPTNLANMEEVLASVTLEAVPQRVPANVPAGVPVTVPAARKPE
jgi:regulator of protease activity HflC (stomatin/prohibitin superfamily)